MLSSSVQQHTCSYHQHHHIILTISRMYPFSFALCFRGSPGAMAQRLWKESERPLWTTQQASRLDEGHFKQVARHEDWCKEEEERRGWQEWEASWAWDWANHCWTWAEVSSVEGWWSGGKWSQEPTALTKQHLPGTRWEEDKDHSTISIEKVHEDMGTHRLKSLTPLSFQPMRHIFMILGRPVMVHMWSNKI